MSIIQAKALRAAEKLYDEMERIDGEAMSQGQIDQDTESERFTWTRAVAEIIAAEFTTGLAWRDAERRAFEQVRAETQTERSE